VPDVTLSEIISKNESDLLQDWIRRQQDGLTSGRDLISPAELRSDSRNLLSALREALEEGADSDISSAPWTKTRELLRNLSRNRAIQGFTPIETASFVLSLKEALFVQMSRTLRDQPEAFADRIWRATSVMDGLALYTTEVFQKSREDLITRQQQEMLELSTPVVELWQGILAVPLIGTLDSNRTQVVMQNLLEAIVAKSASIAIIDITGVPTVDTLVAQHLLRTVAAARLMGADCIISGIRPQIAQTIIHLGVDLGNVVTKATLAAAFQIALRKLKLTVASV
jgi:rsbT co-antagonist protein RsbR